MEEAQFRSSLYDLTMTTIEATEQAKAVLNIKGNLPAEVSGDML